MTTQQGNYQQGPRLNDPIVMAASIASHLREWGNIRQAQLDSRSDNDKEAAVRVQTTEGDTFLVTVQR